MRTEAATSPGLRPPRPTPGPERWPETGLDAGIWPWVAALGGVGLLLMAWSALVARRRQVARSVASETPEAEPKTPSERALRAARAIRHRVAERWGDAYWARTVEEWREAPELAQTLAPDLLARVLKTLELADRVKFAGEDASEDQGTEAESAAEECRAMLAGAISTTSPR
jgi:hypothetical protein